MTLHLAESRVIKNAVLRHKRVCQVGTQIHASRGGSARSRWPGLFSWPTTAPDGEGSPADTAPPEGLDWELWIGPGPMRSFNENIVKSGYAHTLFMDYGGGRTCGMANHILDLPFWGLGLDFPTHVMSTGGKFCIHDNTDAPDTHEATLQFPNLVLTWSMSQVSSFGFNLQDVARYTKHGAAMAGVQRRLGYYLHGVEGALFGNYEEHTVVPQTTELAKAEPPEKTIPPSPGHEREWLDCLKTREEPSCGVTYSHKVNTSNMLANLALKVGRSLHFDPATEQIVDDPEAARLAQPEYRAPWKFPAEYLQSRGGVAPSQQSMTFPKSQQAKAWTPTT